MEEMKQEVAQEVKEVALGEAEINAILDAIFAKGGYEEEVVLPRGHKCVFITRTSQQMIDVSVAIDKKDPMKMTRASYNQLYSLYCLAMSLKSFDGQAMPVKFEDKIALLGEWAGPLIDMLLVKLVDFDDKVVRAYSTDNVKN